MVKKIFISCHFIYRGKQISFFLDLLKLENEL